MNGSKYRASYANETVGTGLLHVYIPKRNGWRTSPNQDMSWGRCCSAQVIHFLLGLRVQHGFDNRQSVKYRPDKGLWHVNILQEEQSYMRPFLTV